jgi:hypothetical protein
MFFTVQKSQTAQQEIITKQHIEFKTTPKNKKLVIAHNLKMQWKMHTQG